MLKAQRIIFGVLGSLLLCSQLLAQNALPVLTLPAAADPNAAQADAFNAANMELLNRYKNRERNFLERVCELSNEQKEKAENIADDPAIKTLVADVLKELRQNPNGILINMGRVVRAERKTANDRFRQGLQEQFAKLLTEQQRQSYQAELKARDDFQCKANTECLIFLLKERVGLEPDQVEPLKESLATWTAAKDIQMSFYLQSGSDNYLPPIPQECYSKILKPDQLRLIKTFQAVLVQHQPLLQE